jgi:hypothetical protein
MHSSGTSWPGRTRLPALGGIGDPVLIADREPVLDENDASAEQHGLELGNGPQELPVFLVGAEPRDVLDAGTVVSASIEDDHLAGRRQLGDVALEVPLGLLALRRRAEHDHPADTRVETLRDALDRSALAGRVATLKEDHHLQALQPDPFLKLDQLELQRLELLEIRFGLELVRR